MDECSAPHRHSLGPRLVWGGMASDLSQLTVDLALVKMWTWWIAFALAAPAIYATRRRGVRYGISRVGASLAVFFFALAWLWPQGLGRVQPGATGIVLRFGAPDGRVLGEGLYYVVPLANRVVQMNTQINTLLVDRAQGVTSDLEPVYASLAVTFHIERTRAIDVYRTLRFEYAARVVRPAIADAWKETTARYAATDLIAKRADVQRAFEAAIANRVERFGLGIDAVSTTRFNFAYAYAQAAQLKVASVQRTLQAEQDLQPIRIESQQSVIRAKSEIEALKLQRKVPLAQLMRMRELELERRAIDKWDGHLPGTDGQAPFIGHALEPHRD